MKYSNAVPEKKRNLTLSLFAAGLAHELGNPLDAVRRYVNLALERSAEDSDTKKYLLNAQKGIARTLCIMNELLDFSRQCYDYPVKTVEIHSLLGQSLKRLQEDEKARDISIRKIFSEESLYIEDHGLLIVLQNLLKNAADAMKGRGTVTVSTWCQNGSVGVAVQDSGEGVEERIAERIFEPFFSTKKPGEGVGIGLALSREIVGRCGGELQYENIPNAGARFVFTVPRKTLSLVSEASYETASQ